MKIMIVRHGDPDYARDTLTPKGWREAALLADYLENIPVTDYYCSPLGRARDTASLTLQRVGRTARICDWMQEFFHPVTDPDTGKPRIPWDFMPGYWTEQPAFYDKDGWYRHPVMQTGDVEAAYKTVCQALDELLASYGYIRDRGLYRTQAGNEDTVVIFCHMGIKLVMLSHLLGIAPTQLWHGFFAAPTSITTLVTEERVQGEAAFRCIRLGSVTHLEMGGEPFSRAGLFTEVYRKGAE